MGYKSLKDKLQQCIFIVHMISKKDYIRKTNDTNWGFFWNVMSPLLYMIILSTFYSKVIQHDIYKFPVYIFIGIIIMNYYNSSTTSSMYCIENNRTLICRTVVPMEIFIVQKLYASLKESFFSSIALVPIMYYFEIKITWRIIELIPLIILVFFISYGISKLLVVAYSFFADISYLYSVFMTIMFFTSCVFIPLEKMPSEFQEVISYNPIYLSICIARNAVMYDVVTEYYFWIRLVIWAAISIFIGNIVFWKNKNKIMEAEL